ncbi:MAG: serine/threonine protein kinase [Ktedonobacteraceae bacterium]|nr:serine/threonine protein kinase [Ktedonobacteraceae bacterium]
MSITPERLDKYQLVERLGHGGIAEVWKALDTQLQRFVAIKLLHPNLRDDPNFLMRFQREAQLIASLHHPNIVQLHDFQVQQVTDNSGNSVPIAYMVMDYVEGQTLAHFIHSTSARGLFPSPQEIVNLFTSISLAIDYAHRQGMIHRDIKPANILLDRRNTTLNPMGEPILTDFGVARLMSVSSSTLSGAQLGTPLYISPEQASGYPGNERSDLYSLGIVLYEITTGTLPFSGNTPEEVISQHLQATPPAPDSINPRISPALSQVIMRSIAKDPSARYASASALTIALAEAFNLPAPESLTQLASSPDPLDAPTILQQSSHSISGRPAEAPAPPAQPISQGGISAGGQYATPSGTPGTPSITPLMGYPGIPPAQSFPAESQPTPQTPSAPPSPAMRRPAARRRGLIMTLVALFLLLLLVSGGLATYLLAPQLLPFVAKPVTGSVFYTSSGQVAPATAQGVADQLQIDMQNVPDPKPGYSYYAWLLGDRRPEPGRDLTGPRPIQPPILITNDLPVHNGIVHYKYQGNPRHDNLLSTTSRFLITEEPRGNTPTAPSTDRTTWRYYGEIPQQQIPGADPGFSALVHIRHLFYDETNISVLALKGGLDTWFFRNTEKIVEWAVSARDYWHGTNTPPDQLSLMRLHFIRILQYLDGKQHSNLDLPPGTPLLVDPYISQVPLLTVDPAQGKELSKDPPGYTDHVILHVGQVAKAPDISNEMRQRAGRIVDAVGRADVYLKQARMDAAQLFKLSSDPAKMTQLSTLSILDNLVTHALYAYLGKLDPTSNQIQSAALQAHYEIQLLATITLSADLPQNV